MTVNRVRLIQGFERLIVVAGSAHGFSVNEQLAEIGMDADILLEPKGRDSAPAVAVATEFIKERDSTGIVVVVASDHYIPDTEHFCREMYEAIQFAKSGAIVTLGIRPVEPSSAYGYIKPKFGEGRILAVDEFVEKPNFEKAKEYIDNGYMWNSGNFIAPVEALVAEFEKFSHDIIQAVKGSIKQAEISNNFIYLGKMFEQAPAISIDYAIMEKTAIAAVLQSNLRWSDLGAWNAIHQVSPKDERGNSVTGDGVLVDVKNSFLRVSQGRFAVLSHVENINVVVEDDVVFVSDLNEAQKVKDVVAHLKSLKRKEVNAIESVFDIQETTAEFTQWLTLNAFPLWWSLGFDRKNNIWRENLTAAGKATDAPCRARVQGRQSYAYAIAGKMGWDGPWKDAVQAGFDSLSRHYKNDAGLFKTLVNNEGVAIDKTPYLYDHTFALLAQGVLAACPSQQTGDFYSDSALTILDKLDANYRRKNGLGYKESGEFPYQSNPHMHMFEVAVTWCESDLALGNAPERWGALADEIANLAVKKFIDNVSGFIREFFDAHWNAAGGKYGCLVDCGHQFEWASLFARWSVISGQREYFEIAKKLFIVGTKGIDPTAGIVVDHMNEKLERDCDTARLWPQTEWLKASLILHDLSNRPDKIFYHEHIKRSCIALRCYIDPASNGLWIDKISLTSGVIEEASPASSFYHIVGAVYQLQLNCRAAK